jgi:hypothetical protein
MKQYIGIAKDHSGSMSSLRYAAIKDYNSLISSLKQVARDTDIETLVSVAEFSYHATINIKNKELDKVPNITSYQAAGGTALFDAVNTLIGAMNNNDKDATYLVMVITDGEENSSRISAQQLSKTMRKLQATDRWTFVFRVPDGYAHNLISLGIPAGNILEWEQTEQGLDESTRITTASLGTYYQGVSRGVKSTPTFYSNMAPVSLKTVQAKMDDISKDVMINIVTDGRPEISSYITRVSGKQYVKGTGFYQLTKPEKAVQDYKLIVVRNKKTGAVYHGAAARQILNLPTTGTIKLIPGDHGDWDIYIQSTSSNRVLPAGTSVLYWPGAL